MCMNGVYYRTKSNLSENEKLMSLVPTKIEKDIRERIDEEVFDESRYIFIRKEGKKHLGYCTSCKKEYEIYEKHNEKIQCPECGKLATVKLTRYKRSTLTDYRTVLFYQKTLKGGEGIVGRGFLCKRNYSGDYKKTKTQYLEMAIYIFLPDKTTKMFYELYGWWKDEEWNKENRRGGFSEASSVFSFPINGLRNIPYSIDVESLKKATENNKYKYCMFEKRYKSDYLSYLSAYNKYPIIESLQKMGFKTLVDYKIKGWSMNRQVNWRGKTVFKVLKLNRAQVKELQQSNIEVTPTYLKYYRSCSNAGYKFNTDEIKEIERMLESYYRNGNILEYTNIKNMYRYVKKQYALHSRDFIENSSVITTWLDYINDCKKLGLDIKKDSVLYPKDLFIQHLRFQKQIKYLHDKELEELLRDNAEKRKRMYFEYNGLLIRPANSIEEIVEEGKKQGHCVGGYAEDHAKGRTNILLLRKIDNPEVPYYTVEVSKDYKVIQVRGKKNKAPIDDVERFMKVYKNVLEKLSKKKSKKINKVA